MNQAAYLLLEDGTIFHGTSFGAPLPGSAGEAVFWTGMTDYQETLSDPALGGKLLVLTHPGVGNVGVNAYDLSGDAPRVRGLIVREASSIASNYRAEGSLEEYLLRHGIPALTGVDTRALTIHLRENGPLRGIIGAGDAEALKARFDEAQNESLSEAIPALESPAEWTEGSGEWARGASATKAPIRLGVLDWGARRDLLRLLIDAGVGVLRIPASLSADEIRALELKGLVLPSGSYEAVSANAQVRGTVQALVGQLPIFALETGALILAEALGAKVEPLKVGRRGPNHTVKRLEDGALLTTTQNHGHRIAAGSLPEKLTLTHTHLHEGDPQGFIDGERKLIAIQYAPNGADDPVLKSFLSWLR